MGMRGGRGFEVEMRPSGIALVTFNQPDRLNSMTQSLKRDLVETMQQAQLDDAVRVVVFTGSGRAFCAGDDVAGGYQAHAEPAQVPALVGRSEERRVGKEGGSRGSACPSKT